MPYYKFKTKDVLRNTLKTHPEYKFNITDRKIYLNNQFTLSGTHVDNVPMVPVGHISLYELNVDRLATNKIYPFITKDGNFTSIGTVTNADYNTSFQYGDIISGSYPMSSSIARERFASARAASSTSHVEALKNTLNYYSYISPHYQYSSSYGDKSQQEINLISIPSIFFDSGIKPGSVDLKFYISGTLAGQVTDKDKNGELIQVTGSTYAQTNGSGSVAGVVLYNEGFVLLTGSWNLTQVSYDFGDVTRAASWRDFAAGANDNQDSTLTPSASFELSFQGTNEISTLAMHAIAPRGHLNHSMNPTYRLYDSASLAVTSGSYTYVESADIPMKNTVSSSFCNFSASFAKQTFISKIGIYDDERNLIAVASLATPVKKTEDRSLTFKLKLDI
jgi:hypothetical protein